jgi:putative sterol carrier protein
VVQYLSDEWMTEAAAALAAAPAPADGDAEAVVLQYDVTAAPGGKRSYALRFDGTGIQLDPGAHKDVSASFTLDYDVAAQIAQGQLSAQAAFMQGRLKLGGDVMVLVRQHALLDGLDDALAELRARTEY